MVRLTSPAVQCGPPRRVDPTTAVLGLATAGRGSDAAAVLPSMLMCAVSAVQQQYDAVCPEPSQQSRLAVCTLPPTPARSTLQGELQQQQQHPSSRSQALTAFVSLCVLLSAAVQCWLHGGTGGPRACGCWHPSCFWQWRCWCRR
jgi:hypothetical protein